VKRKMHRKAKRKRKIRTNEFGSNCEREGDSTISELSERERAGCEKRRARG
jgi:hypothetical protein